MAIVTRNVGERLNGLVRFEFDYDDATLRVVTYRCINTSAQQVWGRATMLNTDGTLTTRVYGQTFPPNATTEQAIPTGAASRLQLYVNAAGKLDGVKFESGDGPLPA